MKALSQIGAGVLAVAMLVMATAGALADQSLDTLPVASVTIYPGDVIAETMLGEDTFPDGTLERFPVVASRADLVGKVARRTILPGKPILKNAVAEPALVARGTIVRAIFEDGGLRITAPVLALQSGSLGALIQARNVASGKVIVGTVEADGTLSLGALQ